MSAAFVIYTLGLASFAALPAQTSIIGPNYQAPKYRLLIDATGGLNSDRFAYTHGATEGMVHAGLGVQWREFIQLSLSYEWSEGHIHSAPPPRFVQHRENFTSSRFALEADLNLVRARRFRLQTGLHFFYKEIISQHRFSWAVPGGFTGANIKDAQEIQLGMSISARLGMVIARSQAKTELISWLGCRLNGFGIVQEQDLSFLPDTDTQVGNSVFNSLTCQTGLQFAWGI